MAGFVPSPNTVAVKLHWTLHGRAQLNVLHALYTIAGPLNPSIAQNIWNNLITNGSTPPYQAVWASTTQLVAIGVLDLRNAGIPELISTGTPLTGTGAGVALADATSLVLTERTALTGKSNRGRIYTLGWVVGSIQANGLALQTDADAAVGFHQALSSIMSAQGLTLAIRSPALPARPSKPGGTLPAKDYSITPVTQILARDLIFDTNRRRTDQLRR